FSLVLLVLRRLPDLARRELRKRAELSPRCPAVPFAGPTPVLDAESVDARHLLRVDDEVLADLPVLVSPFDDRPREHVDRRAALVLDDELVDARPAAHRAHALLVADGGRGGRVRRSADFTDLGFAFGEGLIERRHGSDIDLVLGGNGKYREIVEGC